MRTEDLDNLTSKMVRDVGKQREEVELNKVMELLDEGRET